MPKTRLLLDGNEVKDVKVTIAFPKKRARFAKWAVINLQSNLALKDLSGTEARILLALLFSSDKTLKTKDLSEIVGAPTATICRSARRLQKSGLAENPQRGYWRISRHLCHFGRWNALSISRPRSQQENPD